MRGVIVKNRLSDRLFRKSNTQVNFKKKVVIDKTDSSEDIGPEMIGLLVATSHSMNRNYFETKVYLSGRKQRLSPEFHMLNQPHSFD